MSQPPLSRTAPAGAPPDVPGITQVDLSVVIPAYYGASTIADCLESIQRATTGRRREIIVVESSGDETAEIVRRRFPDVVVIRSETRLTAGAARNRGAAEARGRLIFFVDQDCTVPPEWTERLERHLDDSSVGAAGGAVGIRNLSNLSGCALYFLEFLYHFPGNGPVRRDRTFVIGCNSVYRATALQVVRFPDQTLGEDVLFSHELRKHGFTIVYDPRIEVRHQNREGWGAFFSYNREMGRASASYHLVLGSWWMASFVRVPSLVFLAPAVILPSIGLRLMRSRWSYFFRFLLLSPMCLFGNLVWASGFRQRALEARGTSCVHLADTRPRDSTASY